MMKMPGMYSCREVHEHVATGTVEQLGLLGRVRLRLHLMMCGHCARYVRQLAAMAAQARRLLGQQPDAERIRRLEAAVLARLEGEQGPR